MFFPKQIPGKDWKPSLGKSDPRKQGKEGSETGQGRQPAKGVLAGQLLLWATGQNRPRLVMPPLGQEAGVYPPIPIGGGWAL